MKAVLYPSRTPYQRENSAPYIQSMSREAARLRHLGKTAASGWDRSYWRARARWAEGEVQRAIHAARCDGLTLIR